MNVRTQPERYDPNCDRFLRRGAASAPSERKALRSVEAGRLFFGSARGFRFLAAIAGGLLAAGCSLIPEARSDPTKYYVLATSSAPVTAARPDAAVVHLKTIDLASYLRSRPIIVRRGNNEIEFREFARWGEPLELGIVRVVREELMAQGAVSAVLASSFRHEHTARDYNLTIRVLACEGTASGAVLFRAIWELVSTVPGTSLPFASGDFHPTDLRWDGKTEASLAGELSRAVAGLANEIAGALKK